MARDAALAAGADMRDSVGAAVLKTKANPRDLVTEVDGRVQRVIADAVRASFPDHGFLGEEDVAPGSEAAAEATKEALSSDDWLWVVDPLDGTTNFAHSLPLSTISIALSYRGEVVMGLIHDPFRDECFTAVKGDGAQLNGESVATSATHGCRVTEASSAVVAIGYGTAPNMVEPLLLTAKALTSIPVSTIRMLGSAALHFAWVSAGRLDAYVEADLNAWDCAAGALLVREAGGAMTGFDGSEWDLSTRTVVASNGAIQHELLQALDTEGVRGL